MIDRDDIRAGLFVGGFGVTLVPYHLGLDSLIPPVASVGISIAILGPYLLDTQMHIDCEGCDEETINAPYCAVCGEEKGFDETLNYERLLARFVGGRDD